MAKSRLLVGFWHSFVQMHKQAFCLLDLVSLAVTVHIISAKYEYVVVLYCISCGFCIPIMCKHSIGVRKLFNRSRSPFIRCQWWMQKG